MHSNLPPGCSVNDIPGNRPIDSIREQMEEKVYTMKLEDFMDRVKSQTSRDTMGAIIDAVIDDEVEAFIDWKQSGEQW